MSTGNDPVLPADNQPNPTAIDTAVAAVDAEGAPAAAGGLTFTSPQPDEVDPDDAELSAARAAAKAEETQPDATTQDNAANGKDPAQAATPAAAPGQKPPAQQPAGETVMIPKPRLDEALGRASKAENAAAYWQGVAEARATAPGQPGSGQPAQQPQPTPQERLAQIHSAQDALATKFDNGEITAAEWKKQERELTNQETGIREEALTARLKPATPAAPQGNDDLFLESETAKLEGLHPWTIVYEQVGTDADWAYLKDRAIENLTSRGVDPRAGNFGKLQLRQEIASLADKYGPVLIADRAKAKGLALPGAQPSQGGQQQTKPGLSREAQARAAKLAVAAGAPPDVNALSGHAGDDNTAPSDARIESMSDDEIAALPAATRQRMLGTIA